MGGPLLRPNAAHKPVCTTGITIAGTSWLHGSHQQLWGASAVFTINQVGGAGTIGPSGVRVDPESTVLLPWPNQTETAPSDVDGAGNARRSWQVGFRCAYDVE
jgi:hypothetical protein